MRKYLQRVAVLGVVLVPTNGVDHAAPWCLGYRTTNPANTHTELQAKNARRDVKALTAYVDRLLSQPATPALTEIKQGELQGRTCKTAQDNLWASRGLQQTADAMKDIMETRESCTQAEIQCGDLAYNLDVHGGKLPPDFTLR